MTYFVIHLLSCTLYAALVKTASAAEVSPTAKADWLESLLHPRRHMMQDRKREKAILHMLLFVVVVVFILIRKPNGQICPDESHHMRVLLPSFRRQQRGHSFVAGCCCLAHASARRHHSRNKSGMLHLSHSLFVVPSFLSFVSMIHSGTWCRLL